MRRYQSLPALMLTLVWMYMLGLADQVRLHPRVSIGLAALLGGAIYLHGR
jgi:hypothetical protein